jgi:hypothetical protein
VEKGDSKKALFRETQRFRQIWVWALLIAIAGTVIYSMVQQLILDNPFGTNPAPDLALVILGIVFVLALPVLFYLLNLTTEVRPDGLYYRFFPIHRSFRRIAPDELSGYEARTYSPLREYGGWGIRYGSSGTAFNISGNRGVQLELVNGKSILIGSQRPEELVAALDSIKRGGSAS